MNQADIEKLTCENPFLPLWQVVYDGLKDEIITLKIAPGTRINEKSLAEQLGVSRSPLKMAIDRLIDDTLVVKAAGRSPVVTQFDFDTYRQIIQARRAVECEAAALAAKAITSEALESLDAILQEFGGASATDRIRCSQLDDRFHQIIVDASGNVYLTHMYSLIRPWLLRYRYYLAHFSTRNAYADNLPYHQAIHHALRLHLSDLARSEVAADITCMENMIFNLSQQLKAVGREAD